MAVFEKGHTAWNKGKKLPPLTKEHRDKVSKANKGRKVWNAGTGKKFFCLDCGVRLKGYYSKRCKTCAGIVSRGRTGWNKGKTGRIVSEETREKLRQANLGKKCSEETKKKLSAINMGENNPNYGVPKSEEQKKKISESLTREKHWNWQGGYKKHDYPFEFFDIYREKIRKRDDYTCQNCWMEEEEHIIVFSYGLDVHHIDYDKQNNTDENLITLCRSCHMRTNFNRDVWTEIFNKQRADNVT